MVVSLVLIAVGLMLMSFFIYGKITHYSTVTTIIKTLTSLIFVAVVAYLFAYTSYQNIGVFMLVTLSLDVIGDVVLGVKRIFPKYNKLLTLFGLLFFGFGHLVFVIGLYINFYVPGNVIAIILPIVISLLCGASILVIEKVLKVSFKKLRLFVIFYFFFLSTLPTSSFALLAINGFNSSYLVSVFVGSVLFELSDIILCRTYFGSNPTKISLISCSIAYYFAQFLIAFSLFFLL